MRYCRYYYNPYMKLPCTDESMTRGEVNEAEPLTRQNIDNRTNNILNNLKKNTQIDEKLQSYGVSDNDRDAIIRTIIRYTLGVTRLPVLPANIPARSSQLVENIASDNPALIRFLQKIGLNPNESKRFIAQVVAFTLEEILPFRP